MLVVDKDLRHAGAAAGAAHHLAAKLRLFVDVDFAAGDALALQQRARPRAIGAPTRRIHFDPRHRLPFSALPAVSIGQIRRPIKNSSCPDLLRASAPQPVAVRFAASACFCCKSAGRFRVQVAPQALPAASRNLTGHRAPAPPSPVASTSRHRNAYHTNVAKLPAPTSPVTRRRDPTRQTPARAIRHRCPLLPLSCHLPRKSDRDPKLFMVCSAAAWLG